MSYPSWPKLTKQLTKAQARYVNMASHECIMSSRLKKGYHHHHVISISSSYDHHHAISMSSPYHQDQAIIKCINWTMGFTIKYKGSAITKSYIINKEAPSP
jgi:hypothetical protein